MSSTRAAEIDERKKVLAAIEAGNWPPPPAPDSALDKETAQSLVDQYPSMMAEHGADDEKVAHPKGPRGAKKE